MTETPPRNESVAVKIVGSVVAGILGFFSLGLISRVLYYGFRPAGIHEAVSPFLTYGFAVFLAVHWIATVILAASWGIGSWVSKIALGLALVLSIVGLVALISGQ